MYVYVCLQWFSAALSMRHLNRQLHPHGQRPSEIPQTIGKVWRQSNIWLEKKTYWIELYIENIRLFLRVISKFPKWSSEVHHQNVMCECGSTPCTLVKMTKGNSIAVIKMGIPDTPKLPLRWGKWWQTMRYIGVSYFQIFLKYYDNPKKVVYAASFKAFEILLAMSQPPKPHQGPQLWLEAQRRNWSSNCRWRLQGNFSAFWHFRYSSTKDIE